MSFSPKSEKTFPRARVGFCALAAFVPVAVFAAESATGISEAVPAGETAALIAEDGFFPEVDPFEVEPLRERFLARGGKVNGKIYLSADGAESGEVAAALDVADWLGRVAQAKVPVPVESEFENPRSLAEIPTGIYVGNTRTAAKLGIFAPAGEGETYIIETRGNAVFIVGKTPTATRLAASEFLREALGVEFVWPGTDGAEWEPRGEIPFPRGRTEHLPAFPWRLVGVRDGDWAVHLGFGDLPRYSHNIGNIFTKEIFAEHPELAPTVFDRSFADVSGYYAPQPNLTAEAAVPVAVAAAREFFGKNPDAPMFALGINDCTVWDESSASADAFGRMTYFRNLPNRSAYYYDFVNRVADAFSADEALAEKSVGAIAYLDVQDAPPFPIRENAVPVLCADRSMWVFPEFKAQDKDLMRRWAKSGAGMWGVYDYYYGTPFLFPRLFLAEEAEAIKFVHANGGKIFYAECGPVVAFDAPKVWLASKLLRDPSADADEILSEYYEKTFGAAAPAMKKFYDFACETWRNQGGQFRWIKGWNNENSVEIFPSEKLTAARSIFAEAQAALRKENAGTPLSARERRIAARIDAVDTALTRAKKFTASYFARKALSLAKMETFAETFEALKNPAWRFEEIYDDADFAGAPFSANISAYQISDPRPAALRRVLDFLEASDNAEETALVNRGLERIFGAVMRSRAEISAPGGAEKKAKLSGADASLRIISEAVPAFGAEPDTREDFEEETFIDYAPGDWRAGKNLSYPQGWRCILAASEKMEMSASTDRPHGGNASLRIAGLTERAELVKRYRVRPGKKVLAQVFARGNVSCGSASFIAVTFFDAAGKRLSRSAEALPVGKNPEWRRLVALGEAPAGAATASVRIYVGLQGEGDETFFDDLTVTVF